MLYSLLIIAVIIIAIIGLKRWQGLPAEKRKGNGKKILLWSTIAIVLGLVATGRAHWIMGVLAALLAIAGRVAQFAQYIPLFKKLFGEAAAQQPGASSPPANVDMSIKEAAEILGVDENASNDDIRLAHKKLMQKIHPDRGGTDALAKQINQAKDVLLKK